MLRLSTNKKITIWAPKGKIRRLSTNKIITIWAPNEGAQADS